MRVTGVEGTTHTLPIATVRLQVNDSDQEMPVALSNKLEYDALLGLDVALVRNMIPEGGEEIRQGRPRRICPRPETYAEYSEQGTESEDSGSEEDDEVPSRQENLGEQPTESQVDTSTEDEEETADTTDVLGMVPMTEDMFLHKDDKEKQTRGQKRQERKKYLAIWGQTIPLDGGPEQIREEQIQDQSLELPRRECGQPCSPFFWKNHLLYRRWKPSKQIEEVEQLELPRAYQETVLRMAHQIPWSGHLGRK